MMKILIVGDSGVGKTSIVNRYFSGYFDANTIPTIGYDFTTKVYTKTTKKLCKLQIWDVAGQERYQAVSKLYARNVSGCLIVCDVTNQRTLENTLTWKKIIEDVNGAHEPVPFVLAQNKNDMIPEPDRDFQKEEYIQEFALKNGFLNAFQTSAKNNLNIDECFDCLVEKAIEGVLAQETSTMKNRESLQKISQKYARESLEPGNGNKGRDGKKGWCC